MESLYEKWLQKYLSVSLQLDCTCKGISVWKHGPQSAKNASVVVLLHSICSKGELVITGIPCPWNLIHRGRWTTMLAYTQVWRSKSGHHTLWDIRCDYYEHKWTKNRFLSSQDCRSPPRTVFKSCFFLCQQLTKRWAPKKHYSSPNLFFLTTALPWTKSCLRTQFNAVFPKENGVETAATEGKSNSNFIITLLLLDSGSWKGQSDTWYVSAQCLQLL